MRTKFVMALAVMLVCFAVTPGYANDDSEEELALTVYVK